MSSVTDPLGNETTFSYDLDTGRKVEETNALTNTTRYAYNVRGQLTQTWGDAVYPVQYVYDNYGRRTEMHTYRQDSGFAGDTWPGAHF